MTLPNFREVRPQVAQRPADRRWVPSALVLYEKHGAVVEEELSWAHNRDFATVEEAARFAFEQGTLWLDKEHSEG